MVSSINGIILYNVPKYEYIYERNVLFVFMFSILFKMIFKKIDLDFYAKYRFHFFSVFNFNFIIPLKSASNICHNSVCQFGLPSKLCCSRIKFLGNI